MQITDDNVSSSVSNREIALLKSGWAKESSSFDERSETFVPGDFVAYAFQAGERKGKQIGFQEGHKQGLEEGFGGMLKEFEESMTSQVVICTKIRGEIYGYLLNKNYHPSKSFLKVDPEGSSLLFLVSPADVEDENFLEVYNFAAQFEMQAESQGQSLDISFVAATEHLQQSAILADGYNFSHKIDALESRTA